MGERGDEWAFERIGTAREKQNVERELHELRERLAQVDAWRARRAEIEEELAQVWVEGATAPLPAPAYAEGEAAAVTGGQTPAETAEAPAPAEGSHGAPPAETPAQIL